MGEETVPGEFLLLLIQNIGQFFFEIYCLMTKSLAMKSNHTFNTLFDIWAVKFCTPCETTFSSTILEFFH